MEPVRELRPPLLSIVQGIPFPCSGPLLHLAKYRSMSQARRNTFRFMGREFGRVAAGSLQVLINGVPVPVTFAGSQSSYPGLDQVNVQLPASLAGTGEAQIQIAAGSWISNTVTIKIL